MAGCCLVRIPYYLAHGHIHTRARTRIRARQGRHARAAVVGRRADGRRPHRLRQWPGRPPGDRPRRRGWRIGWDQNATARHGTGRDEMG